MVSVGHCPRKLGSHGFLYLVFFVNLFIWTTLVCAAEEKLADQYKQFNYLFQSGQNEKAARVAKKIAEFARRRYGADSREHANALILLGDTYFERRLYGGAEDFYKRAATIHSSRLNPDHPELILYVALVALAVNAQTNDQPAKLGELEGLVDKLQRLSEPGLIPNDGRVAEAFKRIGGKLFNVGSFDRAIYFLSRAQDMYKGMQPSKEAQPLLDDAVLYVTHLLGSAFKQIGDYPQAEQQLKEALRLAEIRRDLDPESLASVFNDLGNLFSLQDRCQEAIGLYQASLKLLPTTSDRATNQQNLALCYLFQGQLDDAESLLLEVVSALERSSDAGYAQLFRARSNLAALYGEKGGPTKAIPILRENLRAAQNAGDRIGVAFSALALASSYVEDHSGDDALPLLHQALNVTNRLIGFPPSSHPFFIDQLTGIGRGLLTTGETIEAYDILRRAMALHMRRYRMSTDAQDIVDQFERIAGPRIHTSPRLGATRVSPGAALVAAAWQLAENRQGERQSLIGEAFRAMQSVELQSAASALSQTTARLAAADNALSVSIRDLQDLSRRWRVADGRVLEAQTALAPAADGTSDARLRAELTKIEEQLGLLASKVSREFPEYWHIANPPPLDLPEAQRLLVSDEALIAYFVDEDSTYAWVVTKEQADWGRIAIGKQELVDQIRALRCGIDYGAEWSSNDAGARCVRLLGLNDLPSDGLPPFNLKLAHELYESLVGQFKGLIKDKRLLIVPSGPLTSLPFHVLVTEKPQVVIPANADYRGVLWLGRSHANSVLPSVASLKALRESAGKWNGEMTDSYIGFGNPLLSGPRKADIRAWERQNCSKSFAPESLHLVGRAIQQGIAKFFRGGLANVDEIRSQDPLPETADELCFVAGLFQAHDNAVYLGENATEKIVKSLSNDGSLSERRIVHFATHGLVAGETESLGASKAEPALLLTPPDIPTDEDDGLLTASEIAQLRLNADWIVLSACNTASGERLGAEALSGLARAFFYAGARTLLVSHWYVNSGATVTLITGSFAELKGAPKIGRAEALRRAMLALMQKDRISAHPATWAPFVVVGEGAH